MRLEHFQYIVEIARCKSMSKASKKLYITQPSLSTAIQNLEKEVGFQIFKRSTYGVALTDKGEALLAIAENIVHQLDLLKELSNPETDSATNLNLAAVPVFCNALMFQLIQILKRDYPYIHLNTLELRPSKILPALLSGAADLAVGTYAPSTKEQIFQEASKNNLAIEPIFEDPMYCFLHRNHPMARKRCVSLEDLSDSIPALFNDHTLMDSYEYHQPDAHEYAKNYYSFTDRSSVKKAVAKGLAYAILPRLMAYDDIYVTSGMIIPVPLSDADVVLTTYLAYPARGNLPKAIAISIELIRSLYEEIGRKIDDAEQRFKAEETSRRDNQYLLY